MREIILNIIANNLGLKISEIKDDSNFQRDLGADSLSIIELIMALEEKFGISISDEDAEKIQTVGEVIKYMEKRVKPK